MLAVIAVAVGMLGLLVAQTSRHSIDGARLNVAGHQRMLSERLVAFTLLARESAPQDRVVWRTRLDATVNEMRASSQQLRGIAEGDVLIPPDTPAARDYEALVALQDSVKEAVSNTGPEASSAQMDSALTQQRRLAVAITHVVNELEVEWEHQIDRLLMLEAACVILLLVAFAFGLQQAMQPTQEQLTSAMAQLAESESQSRAVLNAMRDGMLLIDATGTPLAWNSGTLEILGLPADASALDIGSRARLLRDAQGEVLPPEQLPSRMTLRSGQPLVDLLLSIVRPDGAERRLSVNTNPLASAGDGAPQAAVVLMRDVTDARAIESERAAQAGALERQNQELLAQADALERGQALFRSLVDTAGSAIVGLDMQGVVFEWNRESESLYGVSREEAIGRNYAAEFVTPAQRDRMRAGIASVLEGQQIRNLLGSVITTEGAQHMVLWNITPLRVSADGPVHGLIAAGLDVTEREASDERFRVLFERSTDAHMLYDASGVIDCNDATLRMLRMESRDGLVGRRPAELSPLRQPDGRLSVVVAGQMRERARVTGHHRFEWTHLRPDGSEFQVEVTLTPLKLHGRPVLLAVWHDITEHKAVELALRNAKEAAESANRTKSEFVTRMNHELRTPLSAIIGFSRVLLRGKSGALTPDATLYTERIRDNGMHLLSLINQILDVAKIEAGRMELEPEIVVLPTLVDETLSMLASTAEAKGLVLRRDMPSQLKPLITDAGKLRQVLINLVGNSIKFTSVGEVVVRVVADPDTNEASEIIVSDTGIGIPPDRITRVFDPFEQGDASTRREFGGTGLGLSIVKTFVELMGATVEVRSIVGVGTTFTLRLSPALRLEDPSGETAVESVLL